MNRLLIPLAGIVCCIWALSSVSGATSITSASDPTQIRSPPFGTIRYPQVRLLERKSPPVPRFLCVTWSGDCPIFSTGTVGEDCFCNFWDWGEKGTLVPWQP